MPHFLRIPWAARVGSAATFEELPTDAPTAVAPFDQPGPTGLVAAVGVVVAGEQVAPRIKDQILRIAESLIDHFEVRSIGLATEDSPTVRGSNRVSFRLDHRGAVTDREVQSAVRSEDQAMEIVAQEADSDSVAVTDAATFVGNAIPVGIAQTPDIGDVGEEHILAAGQHTGGDAVERGGKILGEHRRHRGLASAPGISQQADPFSIRVVACHLVGLQVPTHHRQTVVH